MDSFVVESLDQLNAAVTTTFYIIRKEAGGMEMCEGGHGRSLCKLDAQIIIRFLCTSTKCSSYKGR